MPAVPLPHPDPPGTDDRTGWVLDLRSVHDGNAVNQTGPDGMRVNNATATGEALGHRVEAQRRSQRGRKGTCIRLSAPDGRTLDLIGWLSASTTNAREPVSSALSPMVSYAFKASPTPEQQAQAARAIAAVIETGYSCLRRSITGSAAQALVQCAAEGLPLATYRRWAEAFPRTTATFAQDPSQDPSQDVLQVASISAREIGWFEAADFTPDTARDWFAIGGIVTKGAVDGFAALRDHEWTPAQARTLVSRVPAASKWAAWAPVGPERLDLALRAGLTPTAAKRLLRRGEWDERTLETLAALRA